MAEASRGSSAPALRLSSLQRAWLREIGIEKIWAPQEQATPASGRAAVQAQGTAAADAVAASQVSSVANSGGSRAIVVPEAPEAPVRPEVLPAAGRLRGAPSQRPITRSTPKPETAAHAAVTMPDVASMDLDALRTQVLGCTACGLCEGRRQAVFGAGAQPARWMVVGEAPGEQEDRQGLPFVGKSGELLNAMLAAVGMDRQENVFIANVIKCRPPGNRNPKPEEIAACSPYLMRQIALLKPERILVLGRFAAQTLLGTEATIGSLRGRIHTLKIDGHEIPVVVSYHPAYLLRSPGEKARSWQDLRLAVSG